MKQQLNDYHKRRNEAVSKEVESLRKQPLSQEDIQKQVARIKEQIINFKNEEQIKLLKAYAEEENLWYRDHSSLGTYIDNGDEQYVISDLKK